MVGGVTVAPLLYIKYLKIVGMKPNTFGVKMKRRLSDFSLYYSHVKSVLTAGEMAS